MHPLHPHPAAEASQALAADLAEAAGVNTPAVAHGAVLTLPARYTPQARAGLLAHQIARRAEETHGRRSGPRDLVRNACVAAAIVTTGWGAATAVMDTGPAAWLSVLAAAAGAVAIWVARRSQEDAEERRADAAATALLDACGHDGPACTRAALTEALVDAEDEKAPRWDRWELRRRLDAADHTNTKENDG